MFFSLDANTPKEAHLQINEVKAADGGVYRCRVDFFNSPTKNFRVNLSLVGKWSESFPSSIPWGFLTHPVILLLHSEPPDEPRIFDAQGKEVAGAAGPFREGAELFLSCQVSGGKFDLSRSRSAS